MRWLFLIAAAAATGLLASAQDVIKVDVEVVQVYATVTDLEGRFVTNLKSGNFKIFEEGKEQHAEAFSSDDSPVSVGILFDVNGVMGDNFPLAKQAALEFLRAGNLGNEYFLLEFNDKPQITEDYTHDLAKLEKHVAVLQRSKTRNKTSGAIDAIQFGLEKLRAATNPRRVLLVFTAGGYMKNENKTSQVRDLARQLDAQILGVTILETQYELGPDDYESGLDVMEAVGGDGFASDSGPDFVNICRRISVGIRNQYTLGYRSTNPVHDGKYRRLQVKLNTPGVPDLIVHTRAGYYARVPEGGIQ